MPDTEQPDPKPVVLDGKETTREQLEEAKENKATRIAEKKDGSYVTLKHLHG